MSNGSLPLADVDALAKSIKEHASEIATAESGAKDKFCELWPTIKGGLVTLRSILALVPGVGAIVGMAIGIVEAAGDAAKKALCS